MFEVSMYNTQTVHKRNEGEGGEGGEGGNTFTN